MYSPYDPDLYDFTTPSTFRGDVEWYRRKARETGGPVLELGTGTGRISLVVASGGVVVHALDADRGMLDALRRKLNAAPIEIQKHVVVVLVEQGGHGATTAAPIARNIIEGLYHLPLTQFTDIAGTD